MTEVTAVVVSHPSRKDMRNQLVTEVSQWFPTAIMEDTEDLGCTANHLRAWSFLRSVQTPWAMVLEDDAVPVPNLGYHLGQALFYAPSPVVSLYLGTGRPQFIQPKATRATSLGRPWIVHSRLLHCVAVVVRSDLIHDMHHVAREAAGSAAAKPIDEAITEWTKGRMLPVAYTNPSLVEHADQARVAHHDWPDPAPIPRQAHRFGIPESWSGHFSLM